MNKLLPLFFLDCAFNVCLSFLTLACLIEVLLWILRPGLHRLRSYIRLLPFFKVFYDGWANDWTHWSIAHGYLPSEAPEGCRSLSIGLGWDGGLPYTTVELLYQDWGFSFADIFLPYNSPLTLLFVVSLMGGVSLYRLIRVWILHKRTTLHLHQLTKQSCFSSENIHFSSPFNGSPCTYGLLNPQILIPKLLTQTLSAVQLKAVIHHEQSHCFWKDNMVRLFLTSFQALFWWIPCNWLLRRIHHDWELSCDSYAANSCKDPHILANALIETARQVKFHPHPTTSSLLQKHPFKQRIQQLLSPTSPKWIQCGLIVLVSISLFHGKLWVI